MKCKIILLSLLVAMSNLAYSQQSRVSQDDQATIRQLIAQYLATRLQDDEQALRNLLTDDVDQLPTSGILRTGIDAVTEGSLETSDRTGGDRSITIESIRFVHPDVAIVDGPYDIVNQLDGPNRHYLTSFVVIRQGEDWKITAIRNMQPTQ